MVLGFMILGFLYLDEFFMILLEFELLLELEFLVFFMLGILVFLLVFVIGVIVVMWLDIMLNVE